jgi:thioredoxin-like negative regulator of GroEL
MSDVAATTAHAARPRLVFFHSNTSGRCRRVEAYIAQVLQRRRNHDTFAYYSVAREVRPDIVERFRILEVPTLVVVEDKLVSARLVQPNGCKEIERFLAPWLH